MTFFRAMLLVLLCTGSVLTAQDTSQVPDLTKIGVEQLVNLEVTSVSKKEQKVSEAAVAVFVITQNDIRRSGATSIPELLRMVPGLNVAQIDANKWAITSRGFNSRFANKLLVLIDGRSVYTPLFSGVFWDVQDTMLEDIERIEVIRGPGAALWGANAVNGVINIITKTAKETQGTVISAGAGNEEKGFAAFRYGGKVGERTFYRTFAKYFNRDDYALVSGPAAVDGWEITRGGFRIDCDPAAADSFSFSGDVYSGNIGDREILPTLQPPFVSVLDQVADASGGNLLARWRRNFSAESEVVFQGYYDRTQRKDAVHREVRDTFDFDFQHRFALSARNEIIWGAALRHTRDDLSGLVTFFPSTRGDTLVSAFVQDEIEVVPDRFRVTLGSKFEHNDYTGLEVQPNVRFLWAPDARNTFWAAVSRAVRTPARFEEDVHVGVLTTPAGSLPALTVLEGNDTYSSENLVAYEVGYRAQPNYAFYFDLALFLNIYDELRTFEQGTPRLELTPLPPHLVVPLIPFNNMDGKTYGGELSVSWTPVERWKLNLGYSRLHVQLDPDPHTTDELSETVEGDTPQNQIHIRSFVDLPYRLKFDSAIYYVDELPNQNVDSYTRVDLRFGWIPEERLELAFVVQNLLDQSHPEFGTSFLTNPSEVERSFFANVTVRF